MPTTNKHSPSTMAQSTKVDEEFPKVAEATEENNTQNSSTSTEKAPEPSPITVPCVEEDTRFTELRLLDRRLRKWGEKGYNCRIQISDEAMRSFQLATRRSIQLIGDLNEYIERLEQMNQRLQRDCDQQCRENCQLNAGYLQMQRRMRYLERNNESLKVKCNGLEECIAKEDIARTMLQNENDHLPKALAATVVRESTAMVEFREGNHGGAVFESNPDATQAEVEHKIELSEGGRVKKRTRLN